MSNKYTWSFGETVTPEKMNLLAALAVEDTLYSENMLEITDENGNIAIAIDSNGNISTKNFHSNNIKSLTTFPHYNTIGTPHPYICDIDASNLTLFKNTEAIYTAYDALVDSYPLLFKRNEDLGKDASGQFIIRHYTLGMINPKITTDRAGKQTNQWDDTLYPRKRILINGNIHRYSEAYCCLGCYLMVKEILESTEEWAMFIKNNIVLDIIPEPNPWGYDNKTSTNSFGLNLNRTYFTSIQPENTYIINLIEDLIPKGLCGIIDFHNTGEGTPGYFVAKSDYTHWNYYAILTSQLEIITHNAFKVVHGSDLTNFYHLWDATGNEGQLHQYADLKGLLGCTFEISSAYQLKGSILSKIVGINIINAFAAYEGN